MKCFTCQGGVITSGIKATLSSDGDLVLGVRETGRGVETRVGLDRRNQPLIVDEKIFDAYPIQRSGEFGNPEFVLSSEGDEEGVLIRVMTGTDSQEQQQGRNGAFPRPAQPIATGWVPHFLDGSFIGVSQDGIFFLKEGDALRVRPFGASHSDYSSQFIIACQKVGNTLIPSIVGLAAWKASRLAPSTFEVVPNMKGTVLVVQ